MNERRKITDEREARRCLAAARKTGERAGAWARAHGIDGRSLNAWRINLARRGTGSTPAGMATQPPTAMVVRPRRRAALVELVPASRPSASAPARYAVHLGEVRVEVGDDFAAETLRRILEVLRAC
jgi:transposase-like protein